MLSGNRDHDACTLGNLFLVTADNFGKVRLVSAKLGDSVHFKDGLLISFLNQIAIGTVQHGSAGRDANCNNGKHEICLAGTALQQ